ncbi:MAG: DEAD/DEAH box helicase family protein [Terriglobales bacterium]
MSVVRDLIEQKNGLLLDLEKAKHSQNRRETLNLASLAAAIEGKVARELVKMDRSDDAAINFVSQASCLKDANRLVEARRIYETAFVFSTSLVTKTWITEQLRAIPDRFADPSSVFRDLEPYIEGNAQLRRPQIEAYLAARAHFERTNDHAIIQLPVGCGKTGTISLLPFGISDGRMLVVAPNLEIRQNLAKSLDYTNAMGFLRNRGVLKNGKGPTCAVLGENANIVDCDEASIVVTNIQQLVAGNAEKWLGKLPPDFFNLIALDEGHHNVAPTWKNTLECFPDAKVTSFTATPLRADGQRVEGTRIYRFPIADAIREGYIKDVASHRLEPVDLTFTYKGEKRHHTLEEVLKLKEEQWFSKGVALSPECNRGIVDHSIQCMEELRSTGKAKHQIVAAACSIDHANAVRALYEERNFRAEVIHSKLDQDRIATIRSEIENKQLDVIVQVQMLAEGADYPSLSVAAIFRPYRHFVPYVQFIGRIMRVITPNAPGDPDNRGYVISHVGLNVDRWWEEMRQLDKDDEAFFAGLANSEREFLVPQVGDAGTSDVLPRRRFQPSMVVLQETIAHFVTDRFLPEDASAVLDDVINALSLRGINLDTIGVTREDLETRIRETAGTEAKGKVLEQPVQPQRARQQARRRLEERVRSAGKELLNELKMSVVGFDLPKKFPQTGTTNNIAAAIVLLNMQVMEFLKVGADERDTLTTEQLVRAHDNIDEIIDAVAAKVRGR